MTVLVQVAVAQRLQVYFSMNKTTIDIVLLPMWHKGGAVLELMVLLLSFTYNQKLLLSEAGMA